MINNLNKGAFFRHYTWSNKINTLGKAADNIFTDNILHINNILNPLKISHEKQI